MPRDFVPCLYHERVMPGPMTGVPQLCCDVSELFAVCDVATQAPEVVLSRNSHQYTWRDTSSVDPRADLTETQRIGMRVRLRAQLFRHFYTAMAALE